MAAILNVDQISDSTGTRPVQFPIGVSSTFYESKITIDFNYTISENHNAFSAGPITVADGVEVTVNDGSVWTVV